MATTYVVYQPTMSGDEKLQSGRTISRHRTPKAAAQRIERANARIRRMPGGQNSYLPWEMAAEDEGRSGPRRALTDAEFSEARG